MPYLSHLNFDTVKTAVEGILAENTSEARQLLRDAQELLKQAHAAVASQGLRDLAHELYGSDEIEIDDEGAGTSPADGEGTWVQAWVWISHDELVEHGLEEDEEETDDA